jgi:hypothetical protein
VSTVLVVPQWSESDSDLSSLDSDEAALDYEAELEEQLDSAYASYLERKGESGVLVSPCVSQRVMFVHARPCTHL